MISWELEITSSFFHRVNFMDHCFGEEIKVYNCDDFGDTNLECTFCFFNAKIKNYQNSHGEQQSKTI